MKQKVMEMVKNKVKGIKDFYDDTAMMWTDEWYDNTTMMPFLKKVASILPKGARVLDLGCNSGYETRRMKDLGLVPVGLDFSKKCIEIAKEKNKDIDIIPDMWKFELQTFFAKAAGGQLPNIYETNFTEVKQCIESGYSADITEALKKRGAKKVCACCTHPVLSGPAIERIQNSCIEELVVLDTVPLTEEKKLEKIKVLSAADIFAEAIERIYEDVSVSTLFN